MASDLPRLGVVIVAFASADVIRDCLESLCAAEDVALDIVVVDNGSPDDTLARIRDWATTGTAYVPPVDLPFSITLGPRPIPLNGSEMPGRPHRLRLVETGINGGFAAGVNRGLETLLADPGLDRVWVLNPDSVVPPTTARAFADMPGGFSLAGGRVAYLDPPDQIQIDGGRIRWLTGVTTNANQFQPAADTPPPDPAGLDFITGASMVASRAFLDHAGPIPEDYFLYYEEVDWAMRRGALPLAYCSGALVYHWAGTAIGSPAPGRPASAFSLYFKHRGRMRFLRRHRPLSVVTGLAFSLAKAGQLLLQGYPAEAGSLLRGSIGLPPSRAVRARLTSEAARLAFGR